MFQTDKHIPLAAKLRPEKLEDVIGQDHLCAPGKPLYKMVETQALQSLVLWGPPGCGKTTLGMILAEQSGMHFEKLSAIMSGVADLRKVFENAEKRLQDGIQTLLFIDEIHRFNKSQQDAFLPHVEQGTITLIGATTENPSFELNAALLSRCQVMVLQRHSFESLSELLDKALKHIDTPLKLEEDARSTLIAMADGDGRTLLNMVENLTLATNPDQLITTDILTDSLQRRAPLYDKSDDSHYNLISALHKSVRGSDPDAALYWFSRMLDGGEDPHYIARRMVRMATEDIGLASPQALPLCISAWQTYDRLGSPEGELALAEALIYMASGPKSNAVYKAYNAARASAKRHGSLMPPKHILNAPTSMMKDIGYGKGYEYDHDAEGGFSGQNYFPEDMARENYYQPTSNGFEKSLADRLSDLSAKRKKKAS